jgi:hypothetical protein
METGRRLHIPGNVPEDFAQAVATILLLGVAGGNAWDLIYRHPPETSLAWIREILKLNDPWGLVHPELEWWEHQVQGH